MLPRCHVGHPNEQRNPTKKKHNVLRMQSLLRTTQLLKASLSLLQTTSFFRSNDTSYHSQNPPNITRVRVLFEFLGPVFGVFVTTFRPNFRRFGAHTFWYSSKTCKTARPRLQRAGEQPPDAENRRLNAKAPKKGGETMEKHRKRWQVRSFLG